MVACAASQARVEVDEQRVARDLEASHQVRLQAVGLPVTHHGAGTDLDELEDIVGLYMAPPEQGDVPESVERVS
jgi:hypothetical protein